LSAGKLDIIRIFQDPGQKEKQVALENSRIPIYILVGFPIEPLVGSAYCPFFLAY
jgi:hypothetical protein